MKKLIVLCIALVLCLACGQTLAEKDGLYTFVVNQDNTVTITGFDWANNHGDIYIPEMLGNRMVTCIGAKAFAASGNTAVKITLPDGIRSIGEQAFRGVAITYVNTPLNTVEIGGGAFAECSVSRFNVASGHQVFATIDNALYNKQTKTLIAWPTNKEISEIPKGIVNIGDYAFFGRYFGQFGFSRYGRDADDFFKLPDTVKYIGKYAFAKTSINLDAPNVTILDDYSFYEASVLFNNELSLSRVGDYAFANACININEEGKESIKYGEYRFLVSDRRCVVGDYAFYDVNSHYGVVGTSNQILWFDLRYVTEIGDHAFACSKEYSDNDERDMRIILYQEAFNNISYIGMGAFENNDCFTAINYSEACDANILNNSIPAIPEKAFYNSGRIEGIILSPSIKTIRKSAFEGVYYLEKVKLPENLLTIEDRAFYKCRNLAEITIPASVTMIGSEVFTGCSDKLVITVEAGSYGEVWARTCGYAYQVNGQEEDTSWLDW